MFVNNIESIFYGLLSLKEMKITCLNCIVKNGFSTTRE